MYKYILVLCFLSTLSAYKVDLEPLDHINEEEFEEDFHVEPAEDPVEELKREEALVENEEMIRETNEEFLNGEITWFDKLNSFDNLPQDEFDAEKTGASDFQNASYARGLIMPPPEERIADERSERYFDMFRYSRASVPDSYSSKDLGNVSPVKDQKQCGSCVAFANMGMIETCFKKLTGVFGDYSEQQFVDCGYGQDGANGCNGAWTYSYAKWANDNVDMGLFHESKYPYKNQDPTYTCPSGISGYNQGAKVSNYYYTYSGDEETMKKLVAEKGAVVTALNADGPFQNYGGGVFAGCTSSTENHAVTVVGYGTDNGVDYWLVKNSWGESWGEDGFIRLQRGVGMCGIGSVLVTVDCEAVPGATDAPLTTEAPCEDVYSNCADLAETSCYQSDISTNCQKSCGLCEGMTPVSSYTCYDVYGNCEELAKTNCYTHGSNCQKSCGLCDGMTPVKSNTCFDAYNNCADICSWYTGDQCNLACNRC